MIYPGYFHGHPRSRGLRATMLVLGWLTVCLGLSGCAYTGSLKQYLSNGFKVGPNFVSPPAEVEPHWIDVDRPEVISEPIRHEQWWTVFDDPRMNELIQRTRCQNLTLEEAGYRVLEARTELSIAVGSLFPQQQRLTGTYRRTQISKTALENRPLIAAGVPRSFDRWSTGFDAAWELDFWGKFRRSIEAADARLQVSIQDYDDLLVTLIAETASAYVEFRTFEERIRLAQLNVKAQEGMLEIAKSNKSFGPKRLTSFSDSTTTLSDSTSRRTQPPPRNYIQRRWRHQQVFTIPRVIHGEDKGPSIRLRFYYSRAISIQ